MVLCFASMPDDLTQCMTIYISQFSWSAHKCSLLPSSLFLLVLFTVFLLVFVYRLLVLLVVFLFRILVLFVVFLLLLLVLFSVFPLFFTYLLLVLFIVFLNTRLAMGYMSPFTYVLLVLFAILLFSFVSRLRAL